MDTTGSIWAGNFACRVCKKKRLTAVCFSGTQLRKLREGKLDEDSLRCKKCVTAAETRERQRASEARQTIDNSPPLECSGCNTTRSASMFSGTQVRKTIRKCRDCIEKTEKADAAAIEEKRAVKLGAVRTDAGKVGGDVAARLRAAAEECAVEAELVTGLKPMRGAGRRRGRGRGRGSWRGRGRGL